ncbi:MAG TPA: FAD-dependent monooxygenase [Gammaproteobacteria bacterium]|nr:FAD-dependent monooxygenase [Gammaproteobacteria bacterium]
MSSIPVIIIGAGPAGLATSIALSRQGIQNIVIEKHPGLSIHPKARGINVRTMELCRLWGVEENMRQSELPKEARRFLWMDQLKGDSRGDVSFVTKHDTFSPTEPCLLSQDIFEEKLLACLVTQKNSQILFNSRVIHIEQDDQFVYCELENVVDHTRSKFQCQYLVAADGAKSFVREQCKIGMNGIPLLGTHISVYCKTNLSPWLSDKPFAVLAFTNPEQLGRIMMAVDLKERWIFSKRVADPNEMLTNESAIQLVRDTVDEPTLAVDVINISKWEMAALSAERYRHGRIFFCGDAAHRMPPTGGMGMNTGIGDAHNLAWKLAYVLQGFSDERLLDSYEAERKPLAETTIDWSVLNANRLRTIFQSIMDGNESAFYESLKEQTHHVNHIGLDIGFIYSEHASDTPTFDPGVYESKAIVGMRAPHCEISYQNKKMSTLDLFEKNYVLLAGEACSVEKLTLPISKKCPVTILRIGKDVQSLHQDFYACYQMTKEQAVLVRPDGHVAWIN